MINQDNANIKHPSSVIQAEKVALQNSNDNGDGGGGGGRQ